MYEYSPQVSAQYKYALNCVKGQRGLAKAMKTRRLRVLAAAVAGFTATSCVDMPYYGYPVQAPVIPIVSYPVGNDTCSINRRVMVAPVAFCGTKDGRSYCFQMTLKIRFLGNQVFYYDSTAQDRGIVFEFGKTIDLLTDPRQDARWRAMLNAPVNRTAVAEASRQGDLIRLAWTFSTTDPASRQLRAITGQTMTFRTASCTNSCQVLDYVLYSNNGRVQSDQRLVRQSCRFE